MARKIVATTLHQHWVHSHEEDSETESVYRPASYAFPPSRGRQSFDLRPDGTVMEHTIGADDRSVPAAGTWKLEDQGSVLTFFRKGSAQPTRSLRVASIAKGKLVVKK